MKCEMLFWMNSLLLQHIKLQREREGGREGGREGEMVPVFVLRIGELRQSSEQQRTEQSSQLVGRTEAEEY